MKERPRPQPPQRPLIERAIAVVAPGLAAARARARRDLVVEEARTRIVAAASGLDGARRDRPALRNWNPAAAQTADQAILPGLADLRARARDQHRNAPIARGAVATNVANVVGTGLQLTSQADREALAGLGLTDADFDAAERAIEREWRLFTSGTTADAFRRFTFPEIEELAFRSQMVDGDVFAAVVGATVPGPFDAAIQLIDADAVCNPNRQMDTDTLADGIEYDAAGVPWRIHVAKRHRAGRGVTTWSTLPMRAPDGSPRVLHLMRAEQIGQSRGIPYLAPVLAALKELDTYTEAELRAAVLNACIAIMTQTPDGSSPLKAEALGTGSGSDGGLRRADIDFEPGMVLEGFLPDETLKSFGSERPATGFDPFHLAILRQVGMGLELPYEVLIKHYTASYSAARGAQLDAWRHFRPRRAHLANAFHRPLLGIVVENAVRRGRLALPGWDDQVLRQAWLGSAWNGNAPGQIDPLKEVNAARERIALRISTHAREAAELTGEHWESMVRTLAKEHSLIEQLGVPDGSAPAPPAPAPATPTEPDADDEADQADMAEATQDTAP